MNTAPNFAALSSAELVEYFNVIANTTGLFRAVGRFSDRKTAEARCAKAAAAAALNAAAEARVAAADAAAAVAEAPSAAGDAAPLPTYHHNQGCPACGSTADITTGRCINLHGRQQVVDEDQALCHSCGFAFDYNTGAPLRRRAKAAPGASAKAIAASWNDAEVRAARSARHGVEFRDAAGLRSFPSVFAAFVALSLPLGKHIRFRAELKAVGTLEAFGGVWTAKAR